MNRQSEASSLMLGDPLDAMPRKAAFGIADVVLFFKRRWLLIGLIFAVIVVMLGALLTTMQPRYTATAELTLIDQRQQSTPIADLLTGVPLSRQLVQQEITTMQSKAFMIEVVKRLEIETGTMRIDPPPDPILPVRVLRQVKKFISGLLTPDAPPDALSTAIIPVVDEADAPANVGLDAVAQSDVVPIQTADPKQEAAFVVLAADLEQYGDAADRLSAAIQIAQLGNSYVIGVSAQSSDPQIAAQIANAAAAEYTRFSLNIRGDAIEEQVQLLSARVDDLGLKLEEAETAVVDFQERVMGVNSSSEERLSRQIDDLSRRQIEAQGEIVRADAQYRKVLEIVSEEGPIAAAGVLTSPILVAVRAELSRLRIERSRAVERFGAETEQVSAIDAVIFRIFEEIEIETNRVVAEYETELNIAETIEASFNADLVALEGLMLSRSRNTVALSKLRRIADANRIAYEEFLTIATESAQYKALQQPTVRLLSYAEAPSSPSSPRSLLLLALSGIASLALGLGVAILVEITNTNIKTSRELRQISGLPVIGSLSKIARVGGRKLRDSLRAGEPRHLNHHENVLVAEGHAVASFLVNFLKSDKSTVVVTSSVSDEGASTVAHLIAHSLVSQEESVLLIDAISVSHNPVSGGDAVDACDPIQIVRSETGIPTLSLSRVAQSDPTLMSEKRKSELMKKIIAKYDYVVIDTPPVLSSAVALRFVRDADAIVIASRWNGTARQTIQASVQKLHDLNADNLFMVMTQVKRRTERKYEYAGFNKVSDLGRVIT